MGALTATDRDVISRDGTRREVERSGDGSPVALVCNQPIDHSSNTGVAALLAASFAVRIDDRRGSGSADTPPSAIDREVEEITAEIAVGSGAAFAHRMSSGAGLAGRQR